MTVNPQPSDRAKRDDSGSDLLTCDSLHTFQREDGELEETATGSLELVCPECGSNDLDEGELVVDEGCDHDWLPRLDLRGYVCMKCGETEGDEP